MKIAILGATSQIAKDLIESFAQKTDYECTLFARKPDVVIEWLKKVNIQQPYQALGYSDFNSDDHYDVIINFVGVGNPAQAQEMGSQIFDVTYQYDMMALDYLKVHPKTKYIFLSSGAVYGGNFEQPVTNESVAMIPINNLKSTGWYTIAKLYAEARHRALPELSIIDIRVFNYFSHTQDMNARYFITDMVRALKNNEVFKTSADNIVRDYITPPDFFNLIQSILKSSSQNTAVDCYTKSPVDKFSLIKEIQNTFGLQYKIVESINTVNATGIKYNYYSTYITANNILYVPEKTSIEGIVEQIKLINSTYT